MRRGSAPAAGSLVLEMGPASVAQRPPGAAEVSCEDPDAAATEALLQPTGESSSSAASTASPSGRQEPKPRPFV